MTKSPFRPDIKSNPENHIVIDLLEEPRAGKTCLEPFLTMIKASSEQLKNVSSKEATATLLKNTNIKIDFEKP